MSTSATQGSHKYQNHYLPLPHAKFHPHWCNGLGIGPQKLKFLLRFDQNVEYKRPISLKLFSHNLQFVPRFRMR